ncbi:MAG: hypothetical protein BWY06_02159 [Candidatus Latescibacteria bacterium ADurb.Bin168]|nr:MAG: hypothetical protein BWY06_02159 [Candidatus Latescibacteria bacterium ADurb.Bin168]
MRFIAVQRLQNNERLCRRSVIRPTGKQLDKEVFFEFHGGFPWAEVTDAWAAENRNKNQPNSTDFAGSVEKSFDVITCLLPARGIGIKRTSSVTGTYARYLHGR